MNSKIYTFKYNNYYNRILKKSDVLADYGTPTSTTDGVSFNPGDNISTSQIINADPKGDYLVVTQDDAIVSRWFILEAKRNRTGQWFLTLRRDVAADSYEELISAPAFIEKATVSDTDPAIYNSENVMVNKIKTSEILLKGWVDTPWIVGYVPSNWIGGTLTANINAGTATPSRTFDSWNAFYNAIGGNFVSNPGLLPSETSFVISYWQKADSAGQVLTVIEKWYNKNGSHLREYRSPKKTPTYATSLVMECGAEDNNSVSRWIKNVMPSPFQNYLASKNVITDEKYSELSSLDGLVISVAGRPYKLEILRQSISSDEDFYEVPTSNALFIAIEAQLNSLKNVAERRLGIGNIHTKIAGQSIRIAANPLPDEVTVDIPSSETRYTLNDQPFDMFCIPYDEVDVAGSFTTNSLACQAIAKAFAKQRGIEKASDTSVVCFDVQLLPYCPVREIIGHHEVDLQGVSSPGQLQYIKDANNNNVGFVLWCQYSRFSLNLSYPLQIVESIKESVNLDEYRLVSPNYSGIFELGVAKNGGVTNFTVDCSYKPYSPYIHVAPVFGGLYGASFGDARGLVCGGDFSLSQVSDAWANYQLNNKNYQRSFDRQIESLTKVNKYQTFAESLGAFTGAGAGAASGFFLGGGVGAAAGGVASLAGGIADVAISKTLRDENLSKTKDLYNYSLENIQAMPESLRKIDAFANNNKIYPFIEYYTCTPTERQAFRDRMKYNGMTVGRIGSISDFLVSGEETFVQGQLIRLEDLGEDMHYINQLAVEFAKGLYIKGE